MFFKVPQLRWRPTYHSLVLIFLVKLSKDESKVNILDIDYQYNCHHIVYIRLYSSLRPVAVKKGNYRKNIWYKSHRWVQGMIDKINK